MEYLTFQWPDYLVFASILAVSAGIGFYYACSGGKQKTTREYLLADKSMHWFPVACSLVASFISSQTIIGLPAEVYAYGTMFTYSMLGVPIAIFISLTVFLPVFSQLQVTSIFEYLNLRYGRSVRTAGLISYCFGTLMYVALVTYGPALSLAAVTGMNLWISVFSVSSVAILYTVLGGMKAVLWTDTLQMIIMAGGCIALVIVGVVNEGGLSNIWQANVDSGRMDLSATEKMYDFDPRARHTLWALLLNGTYSWLVCYGTNQSSVQRAFTLRSKKDMKLAYIVVAFGVVIFTLASVFLGMIIFSHFQLCDPLSYGALTSKDQLYPLFVMKTFGSFPGIPGIILAAVFSASLSTISTGLCSMTTVILQDIVKPLRPAMTDERATVVSKFLSLILGVSAVALVFIARYFGKGIMTLGLAFLGITQSPLLGVFTLGILVPIANTKGTLSGFIIGTVYVTIVGMGGVFSSPYVYQYPTTTAGCNITDPTILANLTSPVYDPSTWDPHSHYRSGIYALFDLSYAWNGTSGFLLTFIIGFIGSLITASETDVVKKSLLSPIALGSCCILPKSWRDKIDMSMDGSEMSCDITNSELSKEDMLMKEAAV